MILRVRSLEPESLSNRKLKKWYTDRGYRLTAQAGRCFEKKVWV